MKTNISTKCPFREVSEYIHIATENMNQEKILFNCLTFDCIQLKLKSWNYFSLLCLEIRMSCMVGKIFCSYVAQALGSEV